jgi:hypothetical protein
LTDGDRWAVAEFRAYLAERKTTDGGTMDARKIIESLWDRGGVDVSDLLDRYTHELAEKIRDSCPDHRSADPVWTMCHCEAVDLIDPEAQR